MRCVHEPFLTITHSVEAEELDDISAEIEDENTADVITHSKAIKRHSAIHSDDEPLYYFYLPPPL
jgi:hypothetical protein